MLTDEEIFMTHFAFSMSTHPGRQDLTQKNINFSTVGKLCGGSKSQVVACTEGQDYSSWMGRETFL